MSYEQQGGYEAFSSSQMGGGGHFASPSQNTMNQYGGAGGSGSKGGAKREPSTLVPVMVKQVLEGEANAIGGKFTLPGGQSPSQLKIIANVLSVKVAETHVALDVEDGSGSITIRIYTDSSAEPLAVQESQYYIFPCKAPVKGTLTAFTLVPVTDSNQITVHALECILAAKKATGKLLGSAGGAPGGVMPMGINGMNGGYQQQLHPHAAAAAGAGGYGLMKPEAGMGGGYGELPPGSISTGDPIRDQVLNAFATGADAQTDGGCSVASVVQQLGHLNVSPQQVQEAIQALTNEGHLYSTIDEDHYKTTAQ